MAKQIAVFPAPPQRVANDFSNPLELIREANSNAFDAKAKTITFKFTVEKEQGEPVLHID